MIPITIKIDSEQNQRCIIDKINYLGWEKGLQVTIEKAKKKRSNGQNSLQWPILNAIADQVMWPINGAMTRISGEEFKEILTAGYRKEQVRVALGVDGGMVLLGHRTREFKRTEWGEWMEYLNWFAADRGVKIPMSKSQAERYG